MLYSDFYILKITVTLKNIKLCPSNILSMDVHFMQKKKNRIISKLHLVYHFNILEEIFKSLNTVHIF